MKNYQEFEILAQDDGDTRLVVRGKTIQELFQNALRGVMSFLWPRGAVTAPAGKKITQEIRVEAVDLSSLLVEFLSRVIAEADERGVVFTAAAFRAFGEDFLEADLIGASAEDTAVEIRAVSYADVDIKKNAETGLFETALVLEV